MRGRLGLGLLLDRLRREGYTGLVPDDAPGTFAAEASELLLVADLLADEVQTGLPAHRDELTLARDAFAAGAVSGSVTLPSAVGLVVAQRLSERALTMPPGADVDALGRVLLAMARVFGDQERSLQSRISDAG